MQMKDVAFSLFRYKGIGIFLFPLALVSPPLAQLCPSISVLIMVSWKDLLTQIRNHSPPGDMDEFTIICLHTHTHTDLFLYLNQSLLVSFFPIYFCGFTMSASLDCIVSVSHSALCSCLLLSST